MQVVATATVFLTLVLATVLPVSSDCGQNPMDLVFLADSSSSLRSSDFLLVKQFLEKVVNGLVVSLETVRVALVRFSSRSDVILHLDQSTSRETVISAIRNMKYKPGGTNTSGALAVAGHRVLRTDRGDRQEVGDVLVVITDGRAWFHPKAVARATDLKQRDVQIIALGISRGARLSDLRDISSGVVHKVQRFSGLADIIGDMTGTVCEVGQDADMKKRKSYSILLSSSSPSPLMTTITSTMTKAATVEPSTSSTKPPKTTTTTTTKEPPARTTSTTEEPLIKTTTTAEEPTTRTTTAEEPSNSTTTEKLSTSTKPMTEAPWTASESTRLMTEAPWTASGSSRSMTEAPWTASESTRPMTEAPWTGSESTKSMTEAPWTASGSSRSMTEAPWTASESTKSMTEAPWTASGSSRSMTEAPWTASESTKSMTEAPWTASGSTKSMTEAPWTASGSSRPMTEASWTGSESTRPMTEAPWTGSESTRPTTEAPWTGSESTRPMTEAPWKSRGRPVMSVTGGQDTGQVMEAVPQQSTNIAISQTSLSAPQSPSLFNLSQHADCQEQKMDLIFVQDSSSSVSEDSFGQAKTFITDIVQQLPIGPDHVRVALVRYSSLAHVIAPLSQSTDVSTVTAAIAGMEYLSGATHTGKALEAVRQQVLTEARPDARTVVVILTDGESEKFRQTRQESRTLRDNRVRLVWLYITPDHADSAGFQWEKDYMTNKGDDTFGADSFQALGPYIVRQILNASCQEDPEPLTTPVAPATTSSSSTHSGSLDDNSQTTGPTNDRIQTSDDETTRSQPGTSELDAGELPTSESPSTHRRRPYRPLSEIRPPKRTSWEEEAALSEVTQAEEKLAVTKGQETKTDPMAVTTERPTSTQGAKGDSETSTGTGTTSQGKGNTSPSESGSRNTLPFQTGHTSPIFSPNSFPRLSMKTATAPHSATSDITIQQTEQPESENPDDENASKTQGGREDEEGGWEQSWGNIVMVTVSVFAVAAVTSCCVYVALRRRNKDRQRKHSDQHDP